MKIIYLAVGFIIPFMALKDMHATTVYDPTNHQNQLQQLTQMVEQVRSIREQLEQGRQQLTQAQQHYRSLTGNRGMGEIDFEGALYRYLPDKWQDVYTGSKRELVRTTREIEQQERFVGTVDDMIKHIQQREAKSKAINKAVLLESYQNSQARLNKVESLMRKINTTKDPKEISELQARIAIEQALIQNEMARLQVVSQLQQAERDLIAQQKYEASRRILNPNNKGMPKVNLPGVNY